MANVILLGSDSLLGIKTVKVIKLLKNCLKGFWDNFYDNYNLLLLFFYYNFFLYFP